jgi:DNA replication protein DnaC
MNETTSLILAEPAARVTAAETTQTPASDEPGAIPTVSSKPCDDCGAAVPYERIYVMGRDFGRLLARRCDACATKAKIAADAANAEERRNQIAATIDATIPPELRLTRADHPEFNVELWRVVKSWTPGPDAEWLGLIGPAGCCKTRILALLAMRGIRAGQRVVWTSAVRLQTEAERTLTRDPLAPNAREHLRDCQYAQVLILDDIGKNTWGDRFERHFFEILDHRRNHRLPVLWSANVHPEGFSQVISKTNAGPIIGRLVDRTALFDLFPSE